MDVRRVVIVVLFLGAAAWATGAPPPDTVRITVLHTSDLHGQVLPTDDAADRPASGSLARVSAAVAGIRANSDHPVLLLDSGDTLQGTPLEEFVHVRWGEPSPTIEAMNTIGYEAMAVGNHEFNFGLDPLRRAEQEAEFPFLAANIIDKATGEPAFDPFVVIEAGPVKIGILGLVTPNIPGWEEPANYRGLRFEAMDESARRWVPLLHGREGCDLVIVLAHTGFEVDLDTGEANETAYENFGDRLTRVEGIDLLLTGHAHRDIPPRQVGAMIVSQPSSRGRAMTRVDLQLAQDRDGRYRIASWTGENLDLSRSPIDETLTTKFAGLHQRVVRELARPLTTALEPVSVRGCRLHDCAAQDLIHRAQLEASGADVSLASLLTGRTPDLAPGPVTRRWVRALYVYPNTLRSVKLTGAEIKDVLEYAARYYDGITCTPASGCSVVVDPNVRHYNVDSMQGVRYRIDPTRPEGDRVVDLRRDGQPLDLHETFTLVCNNYRAAGGGGYPHLAEAEVVWQSSQEVASLIERYLEAREAWLPSADGNWEIAPEIRSETSAGRSGN